MTNTETNPEIHSAVATLFQIEAINAVVENYNEHKNEKNKELTAEEVRIIAAVDSVDVQLLLITGRNDGLLYSVLFERDGMLQSKVTLYLYNRIARKIINEGVSE